MTTRRLPPSLAAAANERGFVLVGVVMFVLALTILGISLFSLSSYESQFMGRSLAEEQTFNNACSGIERGKFQISSGSKLLESAGTGFPSEGVDSVVAWQMVAGSPVRVGPVDWNLPVFVRAYATGGGAFRELEGTYQASNAEDYYRRLFTVVGPIVATTDPSRVNRTVFQGDGWQTSGGSGWKSLVNWATPPDSLRYGPVIPTPSVAGYIPAKMATAATVPPDSLGPGIPLYTLDASGYPIRYFTSNFSSSGIPDFSLQEARGLTHIRVRGACVWVLPHGAFFQSKVQIEPIDASASSLVIVAGPSTGTNYAITGVWFDNGVTSTSGIPLILVSNSRVKFQQNSLTEYTTLPYLSVFASSFEVSGPNSPYTMTFVHSRTAPEDTPGTGLIDYLVSQGALPNGSFSTTGLTLVPGTWRQSSN